MRAIFLLALRQVVPALVLLAAMPALAIEFDEVGNRARALAAQPYKAPSVKLPAELRDLDYDAYRDIRFRPEKALWRDEKLPFEVMFFHQGRTVTDPVRINVVEPSGERTKKFSGFSAGNVSAVIDRVVVSTTATLPGPRGKKLSSS